ncbi:MAG: uroporphyrinogen decarboxylase family protein, partial [Methanomassiliicoccales archaeon]
ILIEDGSLGKDQQSRSGAIENNLESTARLVDAIKYTGRWTLIHNCSSEPYLDLHAKLKPSAIDYWVKAKVNPEKVKMDLESTCISTGVDGMSDTVLASPSQIESTILDSYRNYGTEGGFIISTGGEIPLKAPVENIWAIKRAAEKCRSK